MTSLCAICREIPFSRLPSETESAYPHQPSLEALDASATQCQLCRFIQDAVGDLRKSFEDERAKKPVQRFTMYMAPEREGGYATELFFGPQLPAELGGLKGRKALIENGTAGKGDGRVSKLLGAVGGKKDRAGQRGDVLRPWIFGSWWAVEGGGPNGGQMQAPLKLIGIGVRIAKTPDIVDAEGNEGKHVRLRGSQFRVRTLDGRLHMLPSRAFVRPTRQLTVCNRCARGKLHPISASDD
jgi:hypothetical protein